MGALTVADCRMDVQRFAIAMEEKLRANDHKGGWEEEPPADLYEHLQEEVEELGEAIGYGITGQCDDRKLILAEAADVANMAMMVADVCGALRG